MVADPTEQCSRCAFYQSNAADLKAAWSRYTSLEPDVSSVAVCRLAEAAQKLTADLESASAVATTSQLSEPYDSSIATAVNYKIAYVSDSANSSNERSSTDYRKYYEQMHEKLRAQIECREILRARLSYAEKVAGIKNELLQTWISTCQISRPDLEQAVSTFVNAIDENSGIPAIATDSNLCCHNAEIEKIHAAIRGTASKIDDLKNDHATVLGHLKSSRLRMQHAARLLESGRCLTEDKIDATIDKALDMLRGGPVQPVC